MHGKIASSSQDERCFPFCCQILLPQSGIPNKACYLAASAAFFSKAFCCLSRKIWASLHHHQAYLTAELEAHLPIHSQACVCMHIQQVLAIVLTHIVFWYDIFKSQLWRVLSTSIAQASDLLHAQSLVLTQMPWSISSDCLASRKICSKFQSYWCAAASHICT